jgi:hypothetical protein
LSKKPLLDNDVSAESVIGAKFPTVVTSIFPQFVLKVKVFGKCVSNVGIGVGGDTCGTAAVG